ncbi:MAG: hypothetical protein GY810_27990 [Aureispira sp.]|nr:hypothetical protein [Aureispira sp.]
MASRNNKDYQGKTNQHDQINVADDQVSVNQDHQQSHEQIGDDGKSSINSGLEPMSQAIANETSPRDGITGDELYGNSQSNSKVTTNNTPPPHDNQVDSQGVNTTAVGVNTQSSGSTDNTTSALSGGQGDNTQDITREQGNTQGQGGQGDNSVQSGTGQGVQGDTQEKTTNSGQGDDPNPQSVDKEVDKVDQSVNTNKNSQGGDDVNTSSDQNGNTSDQSDNTDAPPVDDQAVKVADQQNKENPQSGDKEKKPEVGSLQQAAADLNKIMGIEPKTKEKAPTTDPNGQGGNTTTSTDNDNSQGDNPPSNTTSTGETKDNDNTTSNPPATTAATGDGTGTTAANTDNTSTSNTNVDANVNDLTADLTTSLDSVPAAPQTTNDSQQADANAQATGTPVAPSDGGAAIGKEHGFMIGVSVGYEKKLKVKAPTGDAPASGALEFETPEEFEGADAQAKRTAITSFRDTNRSLADTINGISNGQIGESNATILKDYVRVSQANFPSTFENYVSGYLRGYNEGYPVGRRKLGERRDQEENARKTTPDYEAGQKIGAKHGFDSAQGKPVSKEEKDNAKAGLDSSGAKIKNKEGNDVAGGSGTTYIQGYYAAYNEYYQKGRQKIAADRKAAEEAQLQDPDFRVGYDLGFATGFWNGRPSDTQTKFAEVTAQAQKNLTDLGVTADVLVQKRAQITGINADNASEEDKKKKSGFYVGYNKGYIQARMAINKVHQDELKAKMEDPAYLAGKQAGELGGMLSALAGSKAAGMVLAENKSEWNDFVKKHKIAITLSDDVMGMVNAGFSGDLSSLDVISTASGDDQTKKTAYFKEAFAQSFNQGWGKGRNKQVQNAQAEKDAKLKAFPDYDAGKEVGTVSAQARMLRKELVAQTKSGETNPKLEKLDANLKVIDEELATRSARNNEADKAFKVGYYSAYNEKVREHIVANVNADNKKKLEAIENAKASDAYKIGEGVGAKVAEQKIALNRQIATAKDADTKTKYQKELGALMAKVYMRKAEDIAMNPAPKTIFEKVKAKGLEIKDTSYYPNFYQGYNTGYYKAAAEASGMGGGGAVDYGNKDLDKTVADAAKSFSSDRALDQSGMDPRELRSLKSIPKKEREAIFKEGADYGYKIWFENQKKSTAENAKPKQEHASEIDKKVAAQVEKIREKYKKKKKKDDEGKETATPLYTRDQLKVFVEHYKKGHDKYGKLKGVIDGDSYRAGFELGKKIGAGLIKEGDADTDYDAARNKKIANEAKVLGIREARYNSISSAIDVAEGVATQGTTVALTGGAQKGFDIAIKPWKKIHALAKGWPIGDDLKDVSIDLPEVAQDPDDLIDLPISKDASELKQQALDKISAKDKIIGVQVEVYKKEQHRIKQKEGVEAIAKSEHEKEEFNDFIIINGALEGAEANQLSAYVDTLIDPDVKAFESGYKKAIEESSHAAGGQLDAVFKAQGFRDGLMVGSEKTKEDIEEGLGFELPKDKVEPDKENEEYKKGHQEGFKAGLDIKLGLKTLSDFGTRMRSAKYQEGYEAGKSKAEEDAKNHGSSAESSAPNLESTNPDPEYKQGYETAYAQIYWPLRAENYGFFKGAEVVKNGGNAFRVPNPIPSAPAEMNNHFAKFEKGFRNGREAAMGGTLSDEDFKKMQEKEALAAKFLNKSKNYRVGFDWGYKRIKDQIAEVKKAMLAKKQKSNTGSDQSSGGQGGPPEPPKEKTSEEIYISLIKTFLSGENVLEVLENQAQYEVAEQTANENNPEDDKKSTVLKQLEYGLAVYSGIKSGISSLKIEAKSTDVSKIDYSTIKSKFEAELATLATKVVGEKKKEDAFKDLSITTDYAAKSSQWIAAVGEFGDGYNQGLSEANPEEIYRFAEEEAKKYAKINAQYKAAKSLKVIEMIHKERILAKEKAANDVATTTNTSGGSGQGDDAGGGGGNDQGSGGQGDAPVAQAEPQSDDKNRDPIKDFPKGLELEPDDGGDRVTTYFRRALKALATWDSIEMFSRFGQAYNSAYDKPYQDYYSYYSNYFLYGGSTAIEGAAGAATTSSGNSAELQQALAELKELVDTHSSLVDFKLKDLPILPVFLEQRNFMEQEHRTIVEHQDNVYDEQEEQFMLEELIKESNDDIADAQKLIDAEMEKPVSERDHELLKEKRGEIKEYKKYIKEDTQDLKEVTEDLEKHQKALDTQLNMTKDFMRDKPKFTMDTNEDDELFTFLDFLKSSADLTGSFDYTDSKMEVKGRGAYIIDTSFRNIEMQAPVKMNVGGLELTGKGFTRNKDQDFVSIFKGTLSVPRVEGDFNEKILKEGNYTFNSDLVFTTSTGIHAQLKHHKTSGKLKAGNA